MIFLYSSYKLSQIPFSNTRNSILKKERKIQNSFSNQRKIVIIPEFIESPYLHQKKPEFSRSRFLFKIPFLSTFLRIFGIFYILGKISSTPVIMSLLLSSVSHSLVVWLNFSIILIIFWLNLIEKENLNKFFLQSCGNLIFLNLLIFGEILIFINGEFFKGVCLSLLGKFFLYFNAWVPLSQHLQISNRFLEERSFLRHMKISFFASLMFEGISKIILFFSYKNIFLDILTFPSIIKNWVLFFPHSYFKSFIENSFKFQAIGDGIFVFSSLIGLYYFAFFILKEIEIEKQNQEKIITGDKIKSLRPHESLLPNPVFLKTNEKLRTYIGDLIEREVVLEKFEKKNNSWAIKKKGINVPFTRIIWNNELPFSKQGLWYEIKKKG